MNNIAQNKRKLTSLLAVSLLALAFILFQPDRTLAQNPVTTPGGTIGRIPRWNPGTNVIGDSLIHQTDTGLIGIGTIAPDSVFHVVGGGASIFSRTVTGSLSSLQSAMQLGLNGGTMLAGGGPSLLFFSDITGATPTKQYMGRVSGIWENPAAGSEAAGLAFTVRANTGDIYAYTEVLRLTSAGKVGIGTSTPVEHLQIGSGGSNYNFSMATSSNNKGFISTYGDVMTLGINRRVNDGLFTDTGKTHAEIDVFSGNADSKILFLTASANNTLASERMRIDKNGNVGIGTTTPGSKLEINGDLLLKNSILGSSGQLGLWDPSAAANAGRFYFWNTGGGVYGRWVNDLNSIAVAESIFFKNNGYVGIGTISPTAKLDVAGDTKVTGNTNVTGSVTASALTSTGNVSAATINSTGTVTAGAITSNGNVGVTGNLTLTGTGNITASGAITGGTINAKYQDIAEWVPAHQAMTNGTVVVLDPERSNHVMTSWQSYDTTVAGIVSDNPGVILGEAGEGKLKIATTGRVKVKVDATNAPIRVGDLLVTSAQEGVAMRSEPLDLAGTKIHRPGTIIGKALEPLAKGKGEILVLLSMQ